MREGYSFPKPWRNRVDEHRPPIHAWQPDSKIYVGWSDETN
jgi:hypothetical protein